MTVKISTGLRQYLAGTGSLRDAFHGTSRISIYAGAEAANADASATGATLLNVILAAGSPLEFEAAASGLVAKSTAQTWSGNNVASGVATWFRLEGTSDDRAASALAVRLQGSIGPVVGDMVMTNPNLVSGAPKQIENFGMTVPESQ
jgi:hypothetical protein